MSGDVRARRYAEAMAVTARARGGLDDERVWLDLLALMDADAVARTAEAPAPTDAREALARVEAVLDRWAKAIREPASDVGYSGGAVLRDLRAALPTAPDAGQRDTQKQAEDDGHPCAVCDASASDCTTTVHGCCSACISSGGCSHASVPTRADREARP